MKALEFKTKIKNNKIPIPTRIQLILKPNQNIRVIVLIDDSEIYDDMIFQYSTTSQFLKGYANSDSIYDN